MKTTFTAFLALMTFVAGATLEAKPLETLRAGDRLLKVSDRMVIVHNGNASPMTATMTLADGSQVAINGAVVSKNGAHRNLLDCEMIGADGRRIEDGSGRVVIIDGQVMMMKGGVTRRLETVATLGGGRSVSQDGVLTERNGSHVELKEGQIVSLSGEIAGPGFEQAKRNIGLGH